MSGAVRIEQNSKPSVQRPQERSTVDAKLQEAFVRAMTRGRSRDAPQIVVRDMQSSPQGVPWSAMLPTPALQNASASPPVPPALDHELTSLVERFCSEVYVHEASHSSSPRLLLALQGGLSGASAELVREGAFLRVRLRAGTDETYRRMQSRCQSLVDALTDHGARPSVIVEVIPEQGSGS